MLSKSAYLWLPVLFSFCSVAICFDILKRTTNTIQDKKQQKPIRVSIPSSMKSSPYGEETLLQLLSTKQVIHYFVPKDPLDSLRFSIIFTEALKLHFQCDSTKVIQVQFGSESSFGSVYIILRFLREHSFRKYCLMEDSLYIFGTTVECDMENKKIEGKEETNKLIYI